jgi:hypothetical protein
MMRLKGSPHDQNRQPYTHVSQLIAAGLDVLTISRRIGHASPAITLNIYSHMFSNTDTRAAEIMEATFANVRSTE